MNTKKILITALLSLFVTSFASPAVFAAGGGTPILDAIPTKSSTSTGKTATINLYVYTRECVSGNGNATIMRDKTPCPAGQENVVYPEKNAGYYKLHVSGSGNTLSTDRPQLNADGRATVTLKSSVAGTKTLHITNVYGGGFTPYGTGTVTFVTPSDTAPAPVKKPTQPSSSTNSDTSTNTESSTNTNSNTDSSTATKSKPKPPAPLKAEQLVVNGKTYAKDQNPEFSHDKAIVFSGKTLPNATVTLIVHSEPQTFTISADKKGNWTQSVDNLEAGEHYAEAAVTDPTTKQTSKMVRILDFSVEPAANAANTGTVTASATTSTPSLLPIILCVIALLALVGVVTAIVYRRKRAAKKSAVSEFPPVDTPTL